MLYPIYLTILSEYMIWSKTKPLEVDFFLKIKHVSFKKLGKANSNSNAYSFCSTFKLSSLKNILSLNVESLSDKDPSVFSYD